MSHIVGEIRKFCETTSVRGIPRIFKSKEVFFKILWTFAVVVCTALLVYLLFTLFGKFYQWPITTRFGQDLKKNVTFPDITICSLNRFANDYIDHPSMNEYFEKIKNLTKFNNDLNWSNMVNYVYNSFYGFMINLPRDVEVNEIDCPNFIATCKIYSKDWELLDDCTHYFTSSWNPEYGPCYTYTASSLISDEGTVIRGMVLVLNIGSPFDEQIPNDVSLSSSYACGVRVAVHTPGNSADMKRGLTVGPGTENTVKIVQTNIKRLGKPHNLKGCSQQENITNSSKIYSQDMCIEDCIQQQIHHKCKCIASSNFIPDSLVDALVCGNSSYFSNIDHGLEAIRCLAEVYQHNVMSCSDICPLPCHETTYTCDVTSTRWPPKFLQLGVYKDYFSECIERFPKVKERYAAYYYLYNSKNGDKDNSTNIKYTISDLKQLEESLLQIKFVIEDDFPYSLVDKEAYTWDVMVGLVGGMLSLWLGISAMTAFELIELLYFILKGFRK